MMEKVTFAVARTTGKASGFGSFEAMLSPKIGRIMRTITTPIKMAFNTEPATKPAGRRHLKEVFSCHNSGKHQRNGCHNGRAGEEKCGYRGNDA